MVTAGVYMIARTHVLFDHSPFALGVVAIVGAATALFAATIALVQNDIKRVLAYSTISQLGYMFLGCGVAAYSAAIFHLMTHAFFKALLFLAAGSVIHAWAASRICARWAACGRNCRLPFWTMTAAVFAIAGFFPSAGFFSKDAILYAAFLQGPDGKVLWFVGLVTALLTSFYMFRLWYLTFLGESRSPEIHPHESPWSMLGPLVILALLSIGGGWIGIERFAAFLWRRPLAHELRNPARPHLELILSVAAVAVALCRMAHRRPALPAKARAAGAVGGGSSRALQAAVEQVSTSTRFMAPPWSSRCLAFRSTCWDGWWTSACSAARPGCWEGRHCLRARSCNAGNRAICAPMRRGWRRARQLCCFSCWFRGLRFGLFQRT